MLRSRHDRSARRSVGNCLTCFALAIMFAAAIVVSIHQGSFKIWRGVGSRISRADHPAWFWMFIATLAVVTLSFVVAGIQQLSPSPDDDSNDPQV